MINKYTKKHSPYELHFKVWGYLSQHHSASKESASWENGKWKWRKPTNRWRWGGGGCGGGGIVNWIYKCLIGICILHAAVMCDIWPSLWAQAFHCHLANKSSYLLYHQVWKSSQICDMQFHFFAVSNMNGMNADGCQIHQTHFVSINPTINFMLFASIPCNAHVFSKHCLSLCLLDASQDWRSELFINHSGLYIKSLTCLMWCIVLFQCCNTGVHNSSPHDSKLCTFLHFLCSTHLTQNMWTW